jgi:cytoskeletal protein RodZ
LVETSAFGEKLRRAREERGVPLDAVASATRIARRHLDALERSDLQSLPSGPFGRSYLRSYAEFLGLDPEPILESYRSEESERGLGPAESRERIVQELSRLLERKPARKRICLSPMLGLVVVACGLVALWWVGRENETDPRPQEPPVTAVKPAPVEAPKVEQAPPQEPSSPTTISVSEWALGAGIVDHVLTGRGNRFSEVSGSPSGRASSRRGRGTSSITTGSTKAGR